MCTCVRVEKIITILNAIKWLRSKHFGAAPPGTTPLLCSFVSLGSYSTRVRLLESGFQFNDENQLLSLVLSTVLAVPTNRTSLTPRSIPAWQFYPGVTAAQHQTEFNKWWTAGYRMISLSVYGQPPNHLYAAVWVQGPLYFAIHDASASAYQSFFDSHYPDGYVSTIVTVTGPPSAPIFAGVMQQNGVTNWYQRCELTTSQYMTELSNAQANHYILKSLQNMAPLQIDDIVGYGITTTSGTNTRLLLTSPMARTRLHSMPRRQSPSGDHHISLFPRTTKFHLLLSIPMWEHGWLIDTE